MVVRKKYFFGLRSWAGSYIHFKKYIAIWLTAHFHPFDRRVKSTTAICAPGHRPPQIPSNDLCIGIIYAVKSPSEQKMQPAHTLDGQIIFLRNALLGISH